MESILETPVEAPVELVEIPIELVEVVEAPLEVPLELVETPVEVPVELVEVPINKPINEVILESPLEKVVKILGFRVSVINIQLGIQAIIAIHINCSCGEEKYTEYKELVLEGEEYTAWGADDNYIVEVVKSKLSSWF